MQLASHGSLMFLAWCGRVQLNQMPACWKMGGQPLAQRLHDKPRVWGDGGLASLIPEAIAQGMIGHSFNCPDMIGGGELGSFRDGKPLDQELFVRLPSARPCSR